MKLFKQMKKQDEIQPMMLPVEAASLPESQEPLPNSDAPSHFDELLDAPEVSNENSAVARIDTTILSEDDFHKVFCLVFNVGSSVTRLSSLKVDESDAAAKGCSKAIYETCLEIPALHFVLQPGGKWGGRILAIGAFMVPMSMNLRDELMERAKAGAVVENGSKSQGNPLDVLKEFDKSR